MTYNTHSENKKRLHEITQIIKKYDIVKNGLSPDILCRILEDLGPTFVKLGQIMSKRTDILPQDYCTALEKLCADSNPLPASEIIDVIEYEFGRPLEEIFQVFEEVPLGSASIAQVHAATLMNGQRVVVKVQRPHVAETMREDISLLRKIVKPLKFAPSVGGTVDFHMLLDELWNVSQQELDFLIEARHLKQFQENNKDTLYVTCPQIYESLTTSRVLTMEFIDGCPISDKEQLQKLDYDFKEIGDKLTENYMKQVLDDGFFHADPHQGNILIRDGKIVWIDMGMVGTLSMHDRTLLKDAVKAIVRKDNNGVIRAIMGLGAIKGELDYTRLYSDIDMLIGRYYNIDLGDLNLGTILQEIIQVITDNHISLPAGISMLARGIVTIEGVLASLSPETNVVQIASLHVMNELRQEHSLKKDLERGMQSVYVSAGKALDIPGLTTDLLNMTLRGQTRLNLNLAGSTSFIDEFNRITNKIIVCIIAAALLVASSLICTTDMQPKTLGIPTLGFVGYLVALILGIILIVVSHHKKK